MGKRLHNLKRSFSSFHFCRTKRGDAVAPTAAAYRLSPYNPKSRDINFPKFPSPPPTTPDDGSRRRQITNQPQRMAPSHSRSPLLHDNLSASDCDSDSIESARRSDAMWQARTNYANKISLHSCDFGPGGDPDPESRNPKLKNGSKKSGAVVAPCDEGDEETEEEEEEDGARDGDETESFRYSSRSFSFDDTSCEFNRAGETTGSENEEVRLLRRAADDGGERRIPNPTDMRRQVLMGLRSSSSAGELGGVGSMGEAMAVVRKSTDPKGDFKRSMLEMIAEKEICDAKELEELLQCLLSLNSREYHGDIVEAFSEIWKVIFIGD